MGRSIAHPDVKIASPGVRRTRPGAFQVHVGAESRPQAETQVGTKLGDPAVAGFSL